MPALPAAPGVIRTALSGAFVNGGVFLSRFYTHYSGTAPTNTQLATFDAAVSSAYTADLRSLVGTEKTLTLIESEDLTSSTGAVDSSPVSTAGTRSGSIVTGAACVVASYTIARRYRGGHPRGYWWFGTDTDVLSDENWNSSLVTAVDTGLTNFFTAVAAAGWTGAGTLTHVNVSYYEGFTVVTSPTTGRARNVPTLRVSPTIDTVTGVNARQSIGTQRRRISFLN